LIHPTKRQGEKLERFMKLYNFETILLDYDNRARARRSPINEMVPRLRDILRSEQAWLMPAMHTK
jgi:hypothetical protein